MLRGSMRRRNRFSVDIFDTNLALSCGERGVLVSHGVERISRGDRGLPLPLKYFDQPSEPHAPQVAESSKGVGPQNAVDALTPWIYVVTKASPCPLC